MVTSQYKGENLVSEWELGVKEKGLCSLRDPRVMISIGCTARSLSGSRHGMQVPIFFHAGP